MKRFAFLALLFTVAFSAQWKIVNLNFATIAIDVAFVSDTVGICAVGDNGSGSSVLATSNGGQKWNSVPGPTSLLYLGAAAQMSSTNGQSGVVCGTLDTQYSHVKKGWNFTVSDLGLQSQNADDFGDGMSYGVVGETLSGGQGVAVSTNYGQHFTFYNITALQTIARYGAFPSATTWYVSAGQWPGGAGSAEANNGDSSVITRQMTKRLHYHYNKDTAKYSHSFHTGEFDTPENSFQWQAQIVKTTDGGKTWNTMFYNHSHYYFNQISCGTELNCVAAAESDSKTSAGVWLFTTSDGGSTWSNTMYMAGNTYSVVATEFVSETEVWAGGAEMGQIGPKFAYFWHSTDSGSTWTLVDNVKGVYPIATSFADPAHGFAVGPNFEDQSSFLSYS